MKMYIVQIKKDRLNRQSFQFFKTIKTYIAATNFVNFDFKLAALFLCIILFLANLSIIATTEGS